MVPTAGRSVAQALRRCAAAVRSVILLRRLAASSPLRRLQPSPAAGIRRSLVLPATWIASGTWKASWTASFVRRSGRNRLRRRSIAKSPIGEGITVKELSEKLGVKANLVIKKLVDRKIFATINQTSRRQDGRRIWPANSARPPTSVSFEEEATWESELAEEAKDQSARAARGHDHGPRRSRQNVAARRDPSDQCCRARSRRHHAAHRRIPGREERPEDRLHRYAGPRSVHPNACPRRQGHRYRHSGGRRGRRRHAADARSDRSRQGGQGADHRRDQQDRQARRAAGANQAATRRSRPAGGGLGRRRRHGSGFGEDQSRIWICCSK